MKMGNVTFTESNCIKNMKLAGKWKEDPPHLTRIDSLVESAYNSEKNLQWISYAQSAHEPNPSEVSDDNVNIYDKSITEEEEDSSTLHNSIRYD